MHFLRFLYCFLLFNVGVVHSQKPADTTQQESQLPSKESIVDENAGYASNPILEYNDSYYILSRINENIGLPPTKFNYRTPQATLEEFVQACRDERFEDAAYALNLNRMPSNLTIEDAAVLAEKLYFVMNQRVNIEWGSISDRPDGQIDIQTATNKAIAGSPRRSVHFGELDLEGRDASLRLQRVKYKDFGAFWLISADTVENIEELYRIYGPRQLELMMPEWARFGVLGLPVWKILGTLILIGLSFLIGKLGSYIVRRLCRKSRFAWLKVVGKNLATPSGFAIAVLFFYITLNSLISFSGPFASWLYSLLLITVISSITWLIMKFIDSFMIYIAENRIGDTNPEENSQARQMLTYVSVARRVVTFVVIIIGITVIISQFRSLEKLGISLLASAGVLTVVLGIAAQSTLGNIIAGIQIALTSPAKIGDTVIINDDWGYVEDIRFTYMVVRTWDQRRLVIPLKYVISNIFENWSMTNPHQVRPIIVHADYRIDVQKVREKYESLLRNHELWDGEHEPVIQVVEAGEDTIEMRALCSGKDASTTWDLHCELREQLVAFIADLEDGLYLTKTRVELKKD
ncbi:mechanosensitive ion channel protein [Nonlabens sp. YIK11]|uniref:mechanosensitive ion channel family protein n=1 Tax=Nonlabens sp. YIK11 TaxID=1453349 RepID=UPI0006DC273A|nr:mechanosensitive ion channel domain-containing protein [Nonlabens sp. YIK11]KQC34340.1 mechanosensitive ion channel protein [Nonlabens sp. YIK11]